MNIDDIPCLVDHETRAEIMDYAAEKLQENDTAVELGVYMGGTIFRLATKLKKLNKFVLMYPIDNWKYENISPESLKWSKINNAEEGHAEFNKYFNLLFCTNQIDGLFPYREDTIKAANLFDDKTVNYLFMDANHGYGGVVSELKAWLPKMADRCLMAIHDYSTPDIARAVYTVCDGVLRTTSNGHTGIIKDTL